MAEPLKREQPSSSVRSLLNVDRAKAAMGPPEAPPARPKPEAAPPEVLPAAHPTPAAAGPTGEAADIFFQVKLTPQAEKTALRLMRLYGEATGLRELNKSEFIRALLQACENAMQMHEREAVRVGKLKRPRKDPAKFHLRDQNEQRLAAAIAAAMRSAPAME